MKSFVDKLGWYRWVNSTGWSTQDIEAIVNEIADSFSPHAVAGGVPARQFRRGIRMISIRETSAGENRMNGPMGRYSELRDSSMKGVVSAASWSDATISILTRDRWYDSDVQALAVMTDKGHAPPHVVRQLASVIYPVFRDAIPMTDYELHRGSSAPDLNKLPLRRKINRLADGEPNINPTLRLRSYRQSSIGALHANKTYKALYTMLHRAARFERNSVGMSLTEHEMNVLKEARDICDELVKKLDTLAQQHINSLKNID